MLPGTILALTLAGAGCWSAAVAVRHERRMQRHRLPGVTYAAVTFRRDGGWGRTDLFAPEGLAEQRRAARAGMIALACWILALLGWLVLG